MSEKSFEELKMQWRKKTWTVPDLLGGKQSYYPLVKLLVEELMGDDAINLDDTPKVDSIIASPRAWREYASFLRGTGLACNRSGSLCLTEEGKAFSLNPTKIKLAEIFQSRFRLFGEILKILADSPATVQEVNEVICNLFQLDWKGCANTRKRMDWLETFELIECAGGHKWRLTNDGYSAMNSWSLVTPEIIKSFENQIDDVRIEAAPSEIERMLKQLRDDPSLHRERTNYNVWVPSPNRIDNLRTIVNFTLEKVTRSELYSLIEDCFGLKQSSVDSIMPFLKASDLIVEVGRGVYSATPVAKAWLKTGNDLDFIRILHGNMRFVGEMIDFAREDVTRNEIYECSKRFGMNVEKDRWIIGFLLEAGLLEETRYLHLKATPLGIQMLDELPLAVPSMYCEDDDKPTGGEASENVDCLQNETELMFSQLFEAARDPFAGHDNSGVAFERAIAKVFSYAGFEVKRIGGSGDTDVLVRWRDSCGNTITATVDAKSKSNGIVTHGDISDIALESHRDKHNASFTAIVGPGFGGDTLKNHAKKKGFALITSEELVQIAKAAHELGLSPDKTALIFHVPDGMSQFEELVSLEQRRFYLTSLVVDTFVREQDVYGSLSARDLSLLLRNTDLVPTIDELIPILDLLASPSIQVLSVAESNISAEHTTYTILNQKTAAFRLSALARAVGEGARGGTSKRAGSYS